LPVAFVKELPFFGQADDEVLPSIIKPLINANGGSWMNASNAKKSSVALKGILFGDEYGQSGYLPTPTAGLGESETGHVSNPTSFRHRPSLYLRLSASCLTAFHVFGASCHSSMSLGVSPVNIVLGSVCASAAICGDSSREMTLFEAFFAVVVFPVARAPSMMMAPNV